MEKDLNYYQRRTAHEKAAAEAASDSRVKAVHIELARRYSERCLRLGNRVDEPRPEPDQLTEADCEVQIN